MAVKEDSILSMEVAAEKSAAKARNKSASRIKHPEVAYIRASGARIPVIVDFASRSVVPKPTL